MYVYMYYTGLCKTGRLNTYICNLDEGDEQRVDLFHNYFL